MSPQMQTHEDGAAAAVAGYYCSVDVVDVAPEVKKNGGATTLHCYCC
jgi:hypothetical protein